MGMIENLYDKIQEAAAYVTRFVPKKIHYAVVAGTGFDSFSEQLIPSKVIPFKDIPHFPKGEVETHKGELIFGTLDEKPILVLAGRSHYYEGFSAKEVAFPIWVLAALDVKHIIFTNAAGGVSPHFSEGDLVMIEDHINFLPDNPLRGKNDDRTGCRFPDMMYAYCPESISDFEEAAKKCNVTLKKGVYLAMQGPSLETPAEYNMAYRLGADLVGMSTVPEVIAARHANVRVSAFSIVSNVCYPKQKLTPTTVADVIKTVRHSSEKLTLLLKTYFLSQ